MNDMAAKAGLEVVSEGMSFRQAFTGTRENVKSFVDEILK